MFSMPPAMAASISPAAICCAAETIACAPEPQTRFTVIAGTDTGTPPPIDACRAGIHPVAGLDDVAHHDAADRPGVEPRTPQRLAHDGRAELGRRASSLSEPL